MRTLHGLTRVFGHFAQTPDTQVQTICSCCLGVMDVLLYFGGHANSSGFPLNCAGVWRVCMRRSRARKKGSSCSLEERTGSQGPFPEHTQLSIYSLLPHATFRSPMKASAIFNTAFTTYPEQWIRLYPLFPSSLITWNKWLISPVSHFLVS